MGWVGCAEFSTEGMQGRPRVTLAAGCAVLHLPLLPPRAPATGLASLQLWSRTVSVYYSVAVPPGPGAVMLLGVGRGGACGCFGLPSVHSLLHTQLCTICWGQADRPLAAASALVFGDAAGTVSAGAIDAIASSRGRSATTHLRHRSSQ